MSLTPAIGPNPRTPVPAPRWRPAAGEALSPGDLVCARADGKVYRFRHEARAEIVGVCTARCTPGEPVPYLDDLDTIMGALQIDAGDRV